MKNTYRELEALFSSMKFDGKVLLGAGQQDTECKGHSVIFGKLYFSFISVTTHNIVSYTVIVWLYGLVLYL